MAPPKHPKQAPPPTPTPTQSARHANNLNVLSEIASSLTNHDDGTGASTSTSSSQPRRAPPSPAHDPTADLFADLSTLVAVSSSSSFASPSTSLPPHSHSPHTHHSHAHAIGLGPGAGAGIGIDTTTPPGPSQFTPLLGIGGSLPDFAAGHGAGTSGQGEDFNFFAGRTTTANPSARATGGEKESSASASALGITVDPVASGSGTRRRQSATATRQSQSHSDAGEGEEGEEETDEDKLALLTRMEIDADELLKANGEYQNQVLGIMKRLSKASQRAEDLSIIAKDYGDELTIGPELKVTAPGWEYPTLPLFKHYYGKDLPPNPDGEARDLYLSTTRYVPWTVAERNALKKEIINHNNREIAMRAQRNGQDIEEALAAYPPKYFIEHAEDLDWEKIALVVRPSPPSPSPTCSKPTKRHAQIQRRNASDCRIQWMQHDHPSINNSKWSKAELATLFAIVERRGERDWSGVAIELDTQRTPASCLRQYRRRPIPRAAWSKEEDDKLREAVHQFGENWQSGNLLSSLHSFLSSLTDNPLPLVARYVGRHSNQCINRWSKTLHPSIRKGKWAPEEDQALRDAVETCGNVWKQVALRVKGRTDAQCRERWVNILDPNILNHKDWTDEDIVKLVRWREEDRKSWSEIAHLFDNKRTDNHCMRRYNEYVKARDGKDKTKAKKPKKRPAAQLNEDDDDQGASNEAEGSNSHLKKKKKKEKEAEKIKLLPIVIIEKKKKSKGKGKARVEDEREGDIVLTDGIPIEPTLLLGAEAGASQEPSTSARRSTRKKA